VRRCPGTSGSGDCGTRCGQPAAGRRQCSAECVRPAPRWLAVRQSPCTDTRPKASVSNGPASNSVRITLNHMSRREVYRAMTTADMGQYRGRWPQSAISGRERLGDSRNRPSVLRPYDRVHASIATSAETRGNCFGPVALYRYFGFRSRASFCASAICAGVILAATKSRLRTAAVRNSASVAEKLAAAKSNHLYAST
jgi:hypothetical protein